jgi:sec-independent protein translocase protein TatC
MSEQQNTNEPEMEHEQPFMAHLIELRDRILRIVIVVIAIFLVLFFFANDLYQWISAPLMAQLPDGSTMIATGVAAPFLTPFKLSLVTSIFIAIPYIFYQFWGFVAPGLYRHEKRLAFPLITSSVILFYSGIVFSFYIVFPLMFAFFSATTPDGVAMMTDISQYLDFVLKMFFAFGIAFEVPIVTIVLTITGVTNAEKLAAKRPYVIVGSFVIGMLLTPPDIVSQTLLAIPVWLLFELGIIFSRIIGKRKSAQDDDNDDDIADQDTRSGSMSTAAATTAGAATAASVVTEDAFGDDDEVDENEPRYRPMTDEEMEAELDAIEASDEDEKEDNGP